MRTSILRSLVLIFAWILYVSGQFYSNPQMFGYCVVKPYESALCLYETAINIGEPLVAAGEIFAVVWVILLFSNEEGRRKLFKVSLAYITVSVLIVVNNPYEDEAFVNFHSMPVRITWMLGGFYILLTLAIILGTKYRHIFIGNKSR